MRGPLKEGQWASLYDRPDSFTDLLPWSHYDPETQVFLLEDWRSVAALFELTPVPTEAATEATLEALSENLQNVVAEAIPEEDGAPWVLQLFVQDDHDLKPFLEGLRAYAAERVPDNPMTQDYLRIMEEHLARVGRPDGLFTDTTVTGARWHARRRRMRATLYRRIRRDTVLRGGASTVEESLNEVANRLLSSLRSAGLQARRCDDQDLYEWLFPWFNPQPACAEDGQRPLDAAPWPGRDRLPLNLDLSEMMVLGTPGSVPPDTSQGGGWLRKLTGGGSQSTRSRARAGAWWFDGLPHRCMTVQGLRSAPKPGHLTGERKTGEHINAVFDLMPEHTIMAMTLVVRPQDETRNHITRVKNASKVDTAEAQVALEQCKVAEEELARGNKLYPVNLAFFVRGEDLDDLRRKVTNTQAVLINRGLQIIEPEADLLALDSYIRNLPMNFDPALDQQRARRTRLMYANQIANLAPFYGRGRGTGHPALTSFNRGGDPLTFDPLNKADRAKNAFALIVGPMGAGKSAWLVYALMQLIAIYRLRVFIIEKGDSFSLLGKYFASRDLSVNQVSLKPSADLSLNPFADALRLLEDDRAEARVEELDDLEDATQDGEDAAEDDAEDKERDILGEMEIAARVMITGGEKKEDERLTRADRLIIRRGILGGARQVQAAGKAQVLPEDVVAALNALSRDPELPAHRQARAQEMADGMALFCEGLGGQFFNRPGSPWPDKDVTIVDMGIFANEGYEDLLAVAYIGLMNRIHALVEARQHESRHTLVVTDEGHIITTNPLLAPYVIKIVKMWRKLGAWFWIATQNLEDFPDESRKMLTTMEWWILLTLTRDEVEQVARFKELTQEQKALIASATKSPGRYTEGAVLADRVQALFRNVPPPEALALAMTEKHEKAERAQIMAETGCTDVEAALEVARRIGDQWGGAR
ncbi:conjugative transfer ATPase [Ectothiorhodospira variabilis]|uniref:conjugative transfer ATPase n=1 Tax=Ectothiorhodospira variabilis TaxID=505694 RepID=UPI001EFA636D|nr:conjugative transfer ATPase [Ectothiorhodospira variabilis]MCG5505175.1 conjugative transfer ATPase [Ectothiorhodospira variabilis]MCG5508332.1 conjugative transfer ATPase [Ectothiorhodospira variabilis]